MWIFEFSQCGERLYTSESDVNRRKTVPAVIKQYTGIHSVTHENNLYVEIKKSTSFMVILQLGYKKKAL